MLGEHLLRLVWSELLARYIGKYGPEAEQKHRSAYKAMTGRKHQLPIPLKRAHDVERTLASLF
jgi:hypothetical protein